MSHEALEKTNKGKSTYPNVWFVGVTPRRNPELVVAVLWQNGEFSYYPARIGAKVVEAFVDKKRRLGGQLAAAEGCSPGRGGCGVDHSRLRNRARRTRRLQRPRARFTADISSSRMGRLWLRTKPARKPAASQRKVQRLDPAVNAQGRGRRK